jgi:predicted transcriptional regulator
MGITKTDLFTEQQNDIAIAAKAFSHPARVAIIQHLLEANSCINGDLVQELGLAQATISQHLRELKDIGIIKGTVEGVRMCYCINPAKWSEIQNQFNEIFNRFEAPTSGDCC